MGITAKQLRDVLKYEPETGIFTWKVYRTGIRKDRVAGCISRQRGVIIIGICGRTYLAHRLAWLWSYGEWPSQHIDHIDGNPSNNCLSNLRDVSRSVNLQNRKRPPSHNRSGLLGVYARDGRWKAEIRINGKTQNLGKFDTKEDAYSAYLNAKRKLHPGCTI